MKKFIMPTVVLVVICIFISAALAFTYDYTKPIIDKNEAEEAALARQSVMPEADGFEEIAVPEEVTGVTSIYATTNDVGYVITGEAQGFGGAVSAVVGIDNEGKIIGIKVTAASETAGVGTKVTNEEYQQTYINQTESLDGISYITGATRSSTALKQAVQNAFQAYNAVTEGGTK